MPHANGGRSTNVSRTPISVLQEVCVRKTFTPEYELISSQGPIHDPSYTFSCRAGEFEAASTATSKRKAKHQAAYLVLLDLLNNGQLSEHDQANLNNLHSPSSSMVDNGLVSPNFMASLVTDNSPVRLATSPCPATDSTNNQSTAVLNGKDTPIVINFVGKLQELCQRNSWPPPNYTFPPPATPMTNSNATQQEPTDASPPPALPVPTDDDNSTTLPTSTDKATLQRPSSYECIVRLWRWEERCVGTSKKAAKRQAAQAMLETIIANDLSIPADVLESMEEDQLTLATAASAGSNDPAGEDNDESPVTSQDPASKLVRLTSRALRGLWNGLGHRITPTAVAEAVEAGKRPAAATSDASSEDVKRPRLPSTAAGYDNSAAGDHENINWCEQLETVCRRIKITSLYTYMHETLSGSVYCLIQLETSPCHVVKGGPSPSIAEARLAAARRAVLFLHQMSSREPNLDAFMSSSQAASTPIPTHAGW